MCSKILHLMNDEKVIDKTIDYFEMAYPNRNTYLIISVNENKQCRYVTKLDKILFCHPDDPVIRQLGNDISTYSHVLVHMLDNAKVKIVRSINHNNITWLAWGADLYDGFLSIKGYKLFRDTALPRKVKLFSSVRLNLPCIARLVDRYRLFKRIKAVKKLKNIAVIDDDYDLLVRYYPEFKHLNKVDYFYYPIDAILGDKLLGKRCSGNKIIIGNSASPNGNHLYALDKIYSCGTNSDIVIPLSYGHQSYKKYIVNQIQQLGKSNIKLLLDFMPLDEYNRILLECSNFVYANLRQEALGNILVAFYIGGKVYLDDENPLYSYFKRLGLSFYSLEDLTADNIYNPLHASEQEKNREIIISQYNLDRLITLIKNNFPLC